MNRRKQKNITYVLVPTIDGIHRAFPVSKHVLDMKKARAHLYESATHIRHWHPSLVQQAASLALMIALCASSYGITYGKLNSTLSYFRDVEVSRGNILAAGSLSFNLNPGEVSMPIAAGEHILLAPLFTPETHTFPIQYRVHAEMIGEPTPLCSRLFATGTTSPFLYSGLLRDLSTEPATTTGHGYLDVSLPDASDLGDGVACTIALVYEGWHASVLEGTGYTDEERDTFTFVFDAPEPEVAPEPQEEEAPPAESVEPEETSAEETVPEEIVEPEETDTEETMPEEPTDTPLPDPEPEPIPEPEPETPVIPSE